MSADREVVAASDVDGAAAGTAVAVVSEPAATAVAVMPMGSHSASAATAAALPDVAAYSHAGGTHALCENCKATLTDRFCASCGQRVEHAVHSLRHFIGEMTEDLTHADSRLWLTIHALLFKPGYLTTEFLAGRRVRYLPPIRLYLVMSVVFFVLLAISPGSHLSKQKQAEIAQRTVQELSDDDDKVTKPSDSERQKKIAERCARLEGEEIGGLFQSTMRQVIHGGCLSLAEDRGHALGEAFMHNLPKALLATLPVMAAIMKLLYWRPRRYYVEHMLFLLHNYAFIFLWLAVFVLVGMLTSGWIKGILYFALLLYPVWYYWVAMRRVYPQGWVRTTVKYNVLFFGYTCVASVALTLDVIYAAIVR